MHHSVFIIFPHTQIFVQPLSLQTAEGRQWDSLSNSTSQECIPPMWVTAVPGALCEHRDNQSDQSGTSLVPRAARWPLKCNCVQATVLLMAMFVPDKAQRVFLQRKNKLAFITSLFALIDIDNACLSCPQCANQFCGVGAPLPARQPVRSHQLHAEQINTVVASCQPRH